MRSGIRREGHMKRHPNDKNKRKIKGITWSKKTQRDKKLKEFYKTHVYTWVSHNRRGWVSIGEEE